jgi:hypothetical protein
VKSKRDFHFSYELYEEMVEAWIEREKGFVEKPEALRDFSKRLAVDLYLNRAKRGAERIPKDELTDLAKEWNVPISDHKLSGRSLLNRDADGNFKFAHRSIMEYLFVQSFLQDPRCLTVEWTDQMNSFLWESFQKEVRSNREGPVFLRLPSLIPTQQIDLLRRVLIFAVETSSPDSSHVATETIVVLCALLLEQLGAKKVRVSLWRSHAGFYYPKRPSKDGINNNFYDLRLTRGLSYVSLLFSTPIYPIERIVLPDRAVLIPHYSTLSRSDKASFAGEVRKANNALVGQKSSRFMVVPIFLGGYPSFVLMAETDDVLAAEGEFSFNERHTNLFSEIFTASLPRSPGPEDLGYVHSS